jgi:TRAP-type C4-dicarboxylate transport system permease small subunit
LSVPPHGPAAARPGAVLLRVCQTFALCGGALLVALIGMSIVSIVGRKLFAAPVPGDLEVMQMGTAVAAAALLPYGEMRNRHIRVDFFTARLDPGLKRRLDGCAHLLLCAVALLLAWRTAAGAWSVRESEETSQMLGWPAWIPVAAMVPSFLLLSLAAAYHAFLNLVLGRTGGAP